MINTFPKLNLKTPVFWFCFGWCLILLVPILPLMPYLQTFIHPWRAEFTASLLFLTSFIFLLYKNWNKSLQLQLSRPEIYFIILPLAAFVFWSGLSIWWSPSWKSALYHTLIWSEYLIFYVIVRQILNQEKGFQSFFIPLCVAILIIGLPPVFEYFSFLVFGGATTLGLRYAKYGELFNTLFPVITIVILRLGGKRFIVGLLLILSMWLFIISTLGRTNLIIFAFGIFALSVAIFIFRRFHKYRRKMAAIVLGLIFVPLPFHLITLLNEEPNVPLIKRVSDDTGISYSTDVRQLLKSVSLEMFKTHPFVGVGADNFGMEFNKYRVAYAEKNPHDVNLMTAESETAERSHNEYLQILAELGVVGGLIFLWFLAGIGLMTFNLLKKFRTASLFPFAALMGIGFFLASSAISSFSFRLVQNGFVFFFVLAIAAKFLLKSKVKESSSNKIILSPEKLRLIYTFGGAACLLLAGYCFIRVTSVYYSYKAQIQPNIEQALPFYQTAFWLDRENPTAHYALAMNLFSSKRYAEAIPQFKEAIKAQRASSPDFSYLATAQTLAGDSTGAEETFVEAVRLYPLSTFVRTRYAALLQARGKTAESAEQLQIALQINKKETSTWWTMMNEGARVASLNAAKNDFTTVMKLNPEPAIYAVVAEREITHPEEIFEIPKSD